VVWVAISTSGSVLEKLRSKVNHLYKQAVVPECCKVVFYFGILKAYLANDTPSVTVLLNAAAISSVIYPYSTWVQSVVYTY